MRRLFAVPYAKINPFQDLLYKKAGELNLEIVGRKSLPKKSEIGTGDIIHLSWLSKPLSSPFSLFGIPQLIFLLRLRKLSDAGAGIVWTVHEIVPNEVVAKKQATRLASKIAAQADVIHFLSDSQKQIFEKEVSPIRNEKTIVVGHPLYGISKFLAPHDDDSKGQKERTKKNLVLVLGSIRPYKRLFLAIRAIQRIQRYHPEYRGVIAGPVRQRPGSLLYALMVSVRANFARDVVVDARYQSNREIADLLSRTSLLLVPTKVQMNSGVLVLGAEAGIRIVCTDSPMARELSPVADIRIAKDSKSFLNKAEEAINSVNCQGNNRPPTREILEQHHDARAVSESFLAQIDALLQVPRGNSVS